MKVFDGFVFSHEYDVLDIRLDIMYDHVDHITIVESDYTFSNKYKGYNLEKNLSRYKKYLDKINYIKVKSQHFNDPFDNEHWQSAQIKLGWKDASPYDLILAAINVDEIIRPEAIEFMKNDNSHAFYNLWMPGFYYKLNYIDTNQHYTNWARAFKGVTGNEIISPIRMLKPKPGIPSIDLHHSGWHFSFLGDEETVRTKVKSYSHVEAANSAENINIADCISKNIDHFGRKDWQIVDLDDYFPKGIRENRDKYNHLILPDSGFSAKDFHNDFSKLHEKD